MENKNAYPQLDMKRDNHTKGWVYISTPGMTLRQHYAGLAMQGLSHSMAYTEFFQTPELLAEEAIRIADALIEKLNK